jgi:hypothetical protein
MTMNSRLPTDKLTRQLGCRLTDGEIDRLSLMSEKFNTIPKNTLIRIALSVGLDAIDKEPARFLLGKK